MADANRLFNYLEKPAAGMAPLRACKTLWVCPTGMRKNIQACINKEIANAKAGKPKEEIQKLENLPGFPDFHVPPGRGNRLGSNLGTAYDELTSGTPASVCREHLPEPGPQRAAEFVVPGL